MSGIHDYSLFILTAVLLNLTPGSDTIFILSNSLSRGRQTGMAAALGIGAGSLIHTLGAALGLSAILMTSALAFTIVKFAGAAYLIYLGIKMLWSKSILDITASKSDPGHFWIPFRQGMITNILNPKVALFFLALLPQFVDRSASQPAIGFILLGLTFITTGTIWGIILACFASFIKSHVQHKRNFGGLLNRMAGVVFIGLGLKLAMSRRP